MELGRGIQNNNLCNFPHAAMHLILENSNFQLCIYNIDDRFRILTFSQFSHSWNIRWRKKSGCWMSLYTKLTRTHSPSRTITIYNVFHVCSKWTKFLKIYLLGKRVSQIWVGSHARSRYHYWTRRLTCPFANTAPAPYVYILLCHEYVNEQLDRANI